ncbi:MAG: TolC family protein [Gemmatimonadales bacterium]|nr:TolC family protein [Gemmatimonadales bacterium]
MILLAATLLFAPMPQDSVTLAWVHARAEAVDPRRGQGDQLAAASEQRTAVLRNARLPQLAIRAQATHQSDVTRVQLPGANITPPPRDRWQAVLQAEQLLFDGGLVDGRVELESARLVEQQAGVHVARYALRGEAEAAFFGAWLLQERLAELDAVTDDLASRLGEVRARVREGIALPRDTAAIEAERLTVMRRRAEADAQRQAAIAVLSRLTDTTLAASVRLVGPVLSGAVDAVATSALDTLCHRPEFAQLKATQDRLAREAALAAAENRPTLSAFAEGGVGRPGLNQFESDPAAFWQGGVRVTWRPWTWRSAERSADALRSQGEVVAADALALAARLSRAVEADLAMIRHLREGFADDARLITLRAEIEQAAQAELAEGIITAARYVEARTDLAEARLAERRHRAELVRAEAAFLTTLGIALPAARE